MVKNKENHNPIHIKIDYFEAKKGKKNILSSELNLLNISKHISKYKELRKEELEKRREIKKKLSKIRLNIDKSIKLFPKPKIPKTLKKHKIHSDKEKQKVEKIQKITIIKSKNNIEDQLKEIQAKLMSLE